MKDYHRKFKKTEKNTRHIEVPLRVNVAREVNVLKNKTSHFLNQVTHCFKKDFNAPNLVRGVCSYFNLNIRVD